LQKDKYFKITRRDEFDKVTRNIDLLLENHFNVKINVVLIKGFNDNEILDFIHWTKDKNVQIRFIEFMPFDGNQWNKEKLVSYKEILNTVENFYTPNQLKREQDKPNDTAKNYSIKNFKGSFAIISSVTNPFCDSCNRIRLTADGKLKNCLFSSTESSILDVMRAGNSIIPFIEKNYEADSTKRILMGCSYGGLFTLYTMFTQPQMFTGYAAASPAIGWDGEVLYKFEKDFYQKKRSNPLNFNKNRSMITIGG